jgi:hypothetical protein
MNNSNDVKKMAKRIRKTAFIMCIFILVFMFVYMQFIREKPETENTPHTTKNRLLEMNLEEGYPETAKGVLETYGRLLQFIYNSPTSDEEVTEAEIKTLVEHMRVLYHSEYEEVNPLDRQLQMLQSEINKYEEEELRIATITVDDKMIPRSIKGKDCSMMYLNIVFSNPKGKSSMVESFILAIEDRRWKILGFQPATAPPQ